MASDPFSGLVNGPASLVHAATYSWDYPSGNVLRAYQIHNTPPLIVGLSGDDGGKWVPYHTGLNERYLDFIWVSTTAAPGSFDADALTVHITGVPGLESVSGSTTFDVYTPDSSTTVQQGQAGIWQDAVGWHNGLGPSSSVPGGIYWTGNVVTPTGSGFVTGTGEFNFLQLVKENRQYTRKDETVVHANFPGIWVLDNQEPYIDQSWDLFNSPDGSAWLTDSVSGHTTADGPNDGLPLAGNLVMDTFNWQSYETYLMYLPAGGTLASDWVPLEMESWSFATSASFTNNHWVPTLGFFPQQNIPGFLPQASEPWWPDVVLNGSGPKHIYP